jgi:hypothetical protein
MRAVTVTPLPRNSFDRLSLYTLTQALIAEYPLRLSCPLMLATFTIAPEPPFAHRVSRRPTQYQHRTHHHVQGAVMLSDIRARESAADPESGVVDEEVDGMLRVGQPCSHAIRVVPVREIGHQDLDGGLPLAAESSQLGGHRIQPRRVAGDQNDVVPSGRQLARELGSDAGCAARDQSRTHGRYDTVQRSTVPAAGGIAPTRKGLDL